MHKSFRTRYWYIFFGYCIVIRTFWTHLGKTNVICFEKLYKRRNSLVFVGCRRSSEKWSIIARVLQKYEKVGFTDFHFFSIFFWNFTNVVIFSTNYQDQCIFEANVLIKNILNCYKFVVADDEPFVTIIRWDVSSDSRSHRGFWHSKFKKKKGLRVFLELAT